MTNTINNDYFYLLFLLIIPIMLFLLIAFLCCCGRCCQVRTNNACNLLICPCFRPDDSSASGKQYDATICYSEYDEQWLDEQFIPQMSQFENNYKIHKLSLYHRSTDKISRENEKILHSSKRIILIFSRKFLKEEWANKSFRNVLRNVCINDEFCVIVAINVGALTQKEIDYQLRYLEIPDKYLVEPSKYSRDNDENDFRPIKKKSCVSRLKSRIKYNCGLTDVERLRISDSSFWKKFYYMMPRIGYDNTKPLIITDSSKDKYSGTGSVKLPKLNNESEVRSSKRRDSDERDPRLAYASEYKNVKSLRHIIVPIPEFMRTQLGFSKKKSKINELNAMSTQNQSGGSQVAYNRPQSNVNQEIFISQSSKSDYQDQKNVFSSIPYSPPSSTMNDARRSSHHFIPPKPRNNISFIDTTASNVGLLPQSGIMKNYLPSKEDVDSMYRRRSTPDILASFKPDPNTVIRQQDKPKKSSSRSSSRTKSPEKSERSGRRMSENSNTMNEELYRSSRYNNYN